MAFVRRIFTVDTHTEGEPTRIVIGGVKDPPGRNLVEKRTFFSTNIDSIRRVLLHEPRGHKGMYGAILVKPTMKEADAAVVFMRNDSFNDDMCVHGTMGVVTALVEMGFVEPKPVIALETPAGLVKVKVRVDDRKVKSATVSSVPSFHLGKYSIEFGNYGRVKVDIAYGGNFYAIIDAKSLGMSVDGKKLRELSRFGAAFIDAVNDSVDVRHPTLSFRGVNHVLFSDKPKKREADARNLVVGDAGWYDRSPCGTGTCAKMVTLKADGKLKLNQEFVHESITGTVFRGRLIKKVKLGRYDAYIPEITGSAYITGYHQFVVDPHDPLKDGFLIE